MAQVPWILVNNVSLKQPYAPGPVQVLNDGNKLRVLAPDQTLWNWSGVYEGQPGKERFVSMEALTCVLMQRKTAAGFGPVEGTIKIHWRSAAWVRRIHWDLRIGLKAGNLIPDIEIANWPEKIEPHDSTHTFPFQLPFASVPAIEEVIYCELVVPPNSWVGAKPDDI
jgi:hypothetical protein